MKSIVLGLLLTALAAPALADDAGLGRRMASCAGVLEAWGAVLKETRPASQQGRQAADYVWKGIRLRKRARVLVGDAASAWTFRASGGALMDMLARNEEEDARAAVDACLLFYAKVMI